MFLVGIHVSLPFSTVYTNRADCINGELVLVCLCRRWFSTKLSRRTFDDDVIKWKHFPRCWPFVRGIHRSPVNSPHKGQWRRALMFSLICALVNGWVNNRAAGDLRRIHAHYDVTVMSRGVNIQCLEINIALTGFSWPIMFYKKVIEPLMIGTYL